MSLAGDGAIAIWQDAPAEVREDFYEWHNREHMPERIAIAGFRRGRRFVALEGAPRYFSLYETDGPQVHTGPDYMQRLNNPTAWTRRVAPKLVNNVRSLCRVLLSLGPAQGGLAMTLRYDLVAGEEEAQRRLLVRERLPALIDEPGVVGVHLLVADAAASSIQTAEKKDRPQAARVPGWVVVAEGGAEEAALAASCARWLDDTALGAAGARSIERGLYRLQYSRTKHAGHPG